MPIGVNQKTKFINGLLVVFNSTSLTDILLGSCRDSENLHLITSSGTLTNDIAVSGVNGLDIDSEIASTMYHVFIIGDTSKVNAAASLLSLSDTAPTMPSGYDIFRRLGSTVNDSSLTLIDFVQTSAGRVRRVFYGESRTDVQVLAGGTAASFTAVDCSDYIPPTSTSGIFSSEFETGSGGAAGDHARVRTTGFTGASTISRIAAGVVSGSKIRTQWDMALNSSQQFDYQVEDAANNEIDIYVQGYVDVL